MFIPMFPLTKLWTVITGMALWAAHVLVYPVLPFSTVYTLLGLFVGLMGFSLCRGGNPGLFPGRYPSLLHRVVLRVGVLLRFSIPSRIAASSAFNYLTSVSRLTFSGFSGVLSSMGVRFSLGVVTLATSWAGLWTDHDENWVSAFCLFHY